MNVITTEISDVLVLEPKVFGDERGFFYESFNHNIFEEATRLQRNFVQDNHSCSVKNVLRGLHYQLPPAAQGKLVRCTLGEVYDVAVDIRCGSPTLGRWAGVHLSAENQRQLWIPEGFAHGFLVLSKTAEFLYKTTAYYSPDHDRCIRWDDEEIGIRWPLKGNTPIVSAKDANGSSFAIAMQENCFVKP
jgi:dTDP-4-dehydrorhamnose 3,5-epimerase